jgi:hypothetical protein
VVPPAQKARIAQEVQKLPEIVKSSMASFSADFIWEPLFTWPAIGEQEYRLTFPTLRDSRPGDPYQETYAVTAHLSNGMVFRSNMMSGSSIDNLAPGPPSGGNAVYGNGNVRISWQKGDETDVAEFIVYRSLIPNEDVSTLTPLGKTSDTFFMDPNPPAVPQVYYYVVGKDINHNEGKPAVIMAGLVTGVEMLEGVPTEFSLSQNFPNPFNPTTNIRFGIPHSSHVRIQIINTVGQLVDEIANTEVPAGFFQVTWNARVPSGIYIYRILAEATDGSGQSFTQVRKMVLLR